jgi:hypothetical protein
MKKCSPKKGKLTATKSSIAGAQETAGIVPREPSLKCNLARVGCRNGHRNSAYIRRDNLRLIAHWNIVQCQVRAAWDVAGKVHLNVWEIDLASKVLTSGLELVLREGRRLHRGTHR